MKTLNGLHLAQTKYVKELLLKANMHNSKPYSTPITTETKLFPANNEPYDHPSLYKSLVGAFQYLTLTRPNLPFSVNKLSQFLKPPT